MKKFFTIITIVIAIVIVQFACNSDQKNNNIQNPDPKSQDCNCYVGNFPSHDNAPNPADGINSPFHDTSTTNCIFHQFSVQKFLWLTRTMPSGRVYFEDSLFQVNITLDKLGPRLQLIDTTQAGRQHGSLHSNPALSQDNKSHMVYYSKHVNQTIMDACKSFADSLPISDTTKIKSNDYVFPVGSLELKASWISLSAIPATDTINYYRTDATIYEMGNVHNDRVALLGLHVVSKVINHPEFIWATFEHDGLAPIYDWSTANDTVKSDKNLLFFVKGITVGTDDIKFQNKSPHNRVFSVFEYGTPRDPGNTFMKNTSQYHRKDTANGDSVNYINIAQINKTLKNNLKNDDVFRNYFYNGAIWLDMDGKTSAAQIAAIHQLQGNINMGTEDLARGSLACKNITMETYTQIFAPLNKLIPDSLGNCYGCHNGGATLKFKTIELKKCNSPLYFSHLFTHYLQNKDLPYTLDKERKAKINDENSKFMKH